MNRKERRAQGKAAGNQPRRPVAVTAGLQPGAGAFSISNMLLGLGGVQAAPVPAATLATTTEADRVHSALAQLRLDGALAGNLERLQRALAANPASEALLHQVARLQVRLDRRADALVTFRRLLALRPDHAEARHMAAILAGEAPDRANETYVAGLFDAFADSFDEKLVGWLDYRAPQAVAAAAHRMLGDRVARRAVDLGCGTGLLGPEVRGLAKRLDGIDLSPRMVGKARDRGCYDDLAVGEIVAALQARPAAYDLVLAADVLSYFGDLKPLFGALHAALQPDGLFVATVEKGAGSRYQAAKTGRYQHGEEYLRRRAVEAGFSVLGLEEIVLRQEENRPVAGYVFSLGRQPPAAITPALSDLSLDDLINTLSAPAGELVLAAAQRMIGTEFSVGWAVDLGGCLAPQATGLRRLAQHLDMIAVDVGRSRSAMETGLYDDCDSGDIIAFLEDRPDHFDLILAADSAIAAADPAAFFSSVKIALALAGVFIGVVPGDPAAMGEAARAEGLFVLATEAVTLSDGSSVVLLVVES